MGARLGECGGVAELVRLAVHGVAHLLLFGPATARSWALNFPELALRKARLVLERNINWNIHLKHILSHHFGLKALRHSDSARARWRVLNRAGGHRVRARCAGAMRRGGEGGER